jgi:hypothetical protein
VKNLARAYIDALADVPALLVALDQDVFGWIDGQPTGRLTVPRRSDRPARVAVAALRKLAPKPTTSAALRGRWAVQADSTAEGFRAVVVRRMGALKVQVIAEGAEPYTRWRWRWQIERTKGRGGAVAADAGDLAEGASWPAVCAFVLRRALELEKSVCAVENATRRGASTAPARSRLEADTPTEPTRTAPVPVAAAPVGQRRVSTKAPPTTAPQRALFGTLATPQEAPRDVPFGDQRIQALQDVMRRFTTENRPVTADRVIEDALGVLKKANPRIDDRTVERELDRDLFAGPSGFTRWSFTNANQPAVELIENRTPAQQAVLRATKRAGGDGAARAALVKAARGVDFTTAQIDAAIAEAIGAKAIREIDSPDEREAKRGVRGLVWGLG